MRPLETNTACSRPEGSQMLDRRGCSSGTTNTVRRRTGYRLPGPHVQNDDWLSDEQSGIPGGRGAEVVVARAHGHRLSPKPPPHLTSGWLSQEKSPAAATATSSGWCRSNQI